MSYDSLRYLLDDHPRTLFPLSTTRIVLLHAAVEIREHISKILKSDPKYGPSFQPQRRCYSAKQGLHLRRTVSLDPVALAFIYDLIYRYRTTYTKNHSDSRLSFGYRFQKGEPVVSTSSYSEFRTQVRAAEKEYAYYIQFDVATYFNSLYHHDLIEWFAESSKRREHQEEFGRFLREINSGRSVDCLPQGLHPCKVVGSEFLRFVDDSLALKCSRLLRFMDDFYIFDNSLSVVDSDFITIQQLLGDKGLSLNAAKTRRGSKDSEALPHSLDDIKVQLLRIRRDLIEDEYGEVHEVEADEDDYSEPLTEEQTEYLLELVKNPHIDESDAELVLTVLRDRSDDILNYMSRFLVQYPGLSRSVYGFCRHVTDMTGLADLLLDTIEPGETLTEDQLFWTGKIAEEYLSGTAHYKDLLWRLYSHPSATELSRAKVLEVPDTRFGLPDLREPHLRSGSSGWLEWASAVGTLAQPKGKRNQLLKYFAKGSDVNRLVSIAVQNA